MTSSKDSDERMTIEPHGVRRGSRVLIGAPASPLPAGLAPSTLRAIEGGNMMSERGSIMVRVRSSTALARVDGLVVFIIVLAKKKNNYGTGPFITNENGEILLTRDQIRKAMDEVAGTFLMDYSHTEINDVIVEIQSRENLERKCKRGEEFFPERVRYFRTLLEESHFVPHQITKQFSLTGKPVEVLEIEV